MRRQYFALFTITLSCTAASFPDYPVKPATEYSNVVAKSGLAVAAVPMDNSEEQLKYFGMDLKSRGYVPVLLVIDNQTPTDSFLLEKESLMYGPVARSGSELANPARPSKEDKTLAVASYLPYYGMLAAVMAAKYKVLRQNVLKSELQSATISPGTSAHGFIFVPARWQHSLRSRINLTIPLTLSKSGEPVIMVLAF